MEEEIFGKFDKFESKFDKFESKFGKFESKFGKFGSKFTFFILIYFLFKKKIEMLFLVFKSIKRKGKMAFRTFKREEGKFFSTKVVDYEEHFKCLSGYFADCASDSLEIYYKLRKAGAKRVRGKRQIERNTDDPKAFHYWVENGNIVFEKHGGVQTIIDKEMFYKNAKITDVSIGEYSGFFRNELPTGESVDWLVEELKKGSVPDRTLLNLINTYKNKNKK